jgi:hypothetical protein
MAWDRYEGVPNDVFPGRKTKRNNPEEQLQRAIWQHIKIRGNPKAIAFAVPNGIPSSKITSARFKAQGLLPGTPDLVFVLPDGRAAFMELKSDGGRLSKEQKVFQERCTAMEVEHVVCSGLDQALAVLTAWEVIK